MRKHSRILACLLLVSILLTGMALPFAPPVSSYQVGDVVANFTLKNVDGKTVSLADYGNQKGVIVIFTCNHCPFAKAYEDRIGELNSKFSSQGYPVVAINPSDPTAYEDDTFDQMRYRAKTKNYSFPYLEDASQTVARVFGASRTPHAFVLKNTGGKFVVQYAGTLDDNPQDPAHVSKRYVEDAVSDLLAGKPVVKTTTRAIGCAIKWKDA